MHLFRLVFCLTFTVTFALITMGQVVSVNKVKFKSLNDDWLMSEIEIATGRNTLSDAISERFIENVGVRLYLGFKNDNIDGGVDFYYSEVTAQILERGDKNTIRFFIPGKEMKMNRYNKPSYYYAEILVNNKPTNPKSRAFSSTLKSEESLKNFTEKAKVGSLNNKGRLLPSYLAPRGIIAGDPKAPAYLRINN